MSVDDVWWIKYRKAKYKPKGIMTMEKLMRMSFKESFKEFVANTGMPGVRQICDPDIGYIQRTIWIIFLIAIANIMIYFMRYTWNGTLSNPLIVTMESNTYPISEIDFPAVALCNVNRISKKSMRALAEQSLYAFMSEGTSNETIIQELEWFILQTGRLLDFSYSDKLRNHPFLTIAFEKDLNIKKNDDRIKNLTPSCEEMLLRCGWNGNIVDCSSIFTVRRTAHGHCCTFNYVIGYNSADNPKTINEVKRQVHHGLFHGLNVVVDPLVEDYAYPIFSMEGIEVMIFDPYHFADPTGGRVTDRFAEANQFLLFELESIKQVASQEVRKYSTSTRNCLFHDEIESFGKIYSYSTCMMRCRILSIRSLCKCIPYYLPTTFDDRMCTLDDLQCLNKYQEKFIYVYPTDATSSVGLESELQSSLFCPECLPDCELTKHLTKSYVIPTDDFLIGDYRQKSFPYNFITGLNMTNKMMISIFQPTNDGVLDRLDVVAYWFEIISNIGGFWGISIGFAIISEMEGLYFMFVRLTRILIFNYKTHYNRN